MAACLREPSTAGVNGGFRGPACCNGRGCHTGLNGGLAEDLRQHRVRPRVWAVANHRRQWWVSRLCLLQRQRESPPALPVGWRRIFVNIAYVPAYGRSLVASGNAAPVSIARREHDQCEIPAMPARRCARFSSIPKTARRLDIGRTKTYELIKTGRLESVKIGKRQLVVVASTERLARAGVDGPAE